MIFFYNQHVLLLLAEKPIKIKKKNPKVFDFIFRQMAESLCGLVALFYPQFKTAGVLKDPAATPPGGAQQLGQCVKAGWPTASELLEMSLETPGCCSLDHSGFRASKAGCADCTLSRGVQLRKERSRLQLDLGVLLRRPLLTGLLN